MTVLEASPVQPTVGIVLFSAALLCWLPIANNGLLHAQVEEEDYACLAGFKDIVEDRQHALVSWKLFSHRSPSSKPPCNGSISWWSGVTCQNNRVFSISLSRTGLSGAMPTSLARCSALNSLDLSANQLSGEIPANLGSLANLVSLNLSGNELTGEIPSELSNCSYLNTLDLHENALAGSIPGELGLLERLQVFDVSDNGLSGPIPTVLSYSVGGGPRFNASSFDGNKDLFGFPLSSSESSGHTLSLLEIVGIGLASGIFSLTVSFTAVCIWLKMAEQRRAAEEGKICELMSEA